MTRPIPLPVRATGVIAAEDLSPELWRRVEEILQTRAGSPGSGATAVLQAGARTFEASAHALAGESASTIVVVVAEGGARAGLPDESLLQERFGLTDREAEVALLIAERRTNREVARLLGVTVYTARRHTEKVLMKMQVENRFRVRERMRAVMEAHLHERAERRVAAERAAEREAAVWALRSQDSRCVA